MECRDELDIAVVISSRAKAYGIARARRGGVPVEVIPSPLAGAANRVQAEKWVIDTLEKYRVQKIFLAGFMKIISPEFIGRFENRIYNIHPSLLPKHKGLDAFGRALKEGDEYAGATVHEVAAEVDSGSMVLQRKFEIPTHRHENLSHLWLHINEQKVMREALRKLKGGARFE